MKNIDYSGLDVNTLRTFLTVLEEVSVSNAADRLNLSQSAVSHTLDKLRTTFNDPLFVRSGRGIIPTAKAYSLREPIKSILDELRSLIHERAFDPSTEAIEFTIATNDLPIQIIFPKLLQGLYRQNIHPLLHFIPSGVPSANLSRASRCQMLITPAPPEGKDILRKELIKSKMVCFYDAKVRKPPTTWKQYANSRYVEVQFSDTESSLMVLPSIDTSSLNPPTITVPNFSVLSAFIKGTNYITSQLSLMSEGPLSGLDSAPLPFKTKPLTIYMVWHHRDDNDPAHQWLRQKVLESVNSNR